MTPHSHEEKLQEEKNNHDTSSDTIWNWLADIFDANLGEGHLECSSIQDDSLSNTTTNIANIAPIGIFFLAFSLLDLTPDNDSISSDLKTTRLLVHQDYYALSSGLRAPPVTA